MLQHSDNGKDKKRFEALAEKWRLGTLSPEEEKEFDNWYHQQDDEDLNIPENFAHSEEELEHRIWNKIQERRTGKIRRLTRHFILKMTAAAVLIGITILGIHFWMQPQSANVPVAETSPVQEFPLPGKDRALLTLANGHKIELDSASNGQLVNNNGIKIIKQKNGVLLFSVTESNKKELIGYNTIQTQRGGQYRIILPDGTAVWLNAASSLRFPTAFTGGERKVHLQGEGYFEVTKNNQMPFKVAVNGMEVKVLGTHFNIMAYPGEDMVSTTLLEGAVQVSKGQRQTRLHPGQQAQLNEAGTFQVMNDVDLEQVMAWKNGDFYFENTGLQTIMRQIERWYDVRITYEGKVPEARLSGIISRKEEVGQLLDILQSTRKVEFKINGNHITVSSHKNH